MGMCMMLRSQERDWTVMPLDILEQISDRLPLVDYVRFRGACKHWRSSPSARAELVNFSKDRPWAMFYGLQRDETRIPECYVYSKSHPHRCTIMLHDLEGATVVKSKHGWLLAHRGWSTETISDASSDFIDTIAKVITCNLIHDEDDQRDAAVKNTVCIYEFIITC
ncbi:uncharacterized protein A4U43_C07F6320 [Asparagus officinalis]|uniref:F-box domain-containing protein n=1 Tax=Asparagus officinalis TaxID=4686 RepID=A0A5P1EA68_ASPOF|nr:uncharacterized protein A4U43_C07F6320 [Asparagus officinalis]